jgi:plasmid stability protein
MIDCNQRNHNREFEAMPSITIRNVPDEVHRAIRVRAAIHGRSTEAEIRSILEQAAKPEGRLKLGSLLTSIAREAGGLSDTEAERFNQLRDKTPAEPMSFE